MYRIYQIDYTPNEGSQIFFDVRTQKMAIKLVKYLNNNTNYKCWVWA